MDIRIFRKNEKMLVQLVGRVVLDECDRLKGAVVPRITNEIKQVNLDLSRVDFIDSAGLGVLVGMKVSSNKSRATLTLVAPSKGVADILMVSKLDSIFEIKTGREAEVVLAELARNEFLTTGDPAGASTAPPASPGFQAPPSPANQQTVGGAGRDQIERLCDAARDHLKVRDYEAAAECYRKVMEIDGEYLPALNNLGIIYEKKPEWRDKAIQQWERVLDIARRHGDQKHIERAQKHLQALT
jgi:anti-anti-sigma factor